MPFLIPKTTINPHSIIANSCQYILSDFPANDEKYNSFDITDKYSPVIDAYTYFITQPVTIE